MNMTKGSCVIRPRDVELFVALERFRCLTLDQISAALFQGMGHRVCDQLFLSTRGRANKKLNVPYQRLQKLAHGGYVERRIGQVWGQMFRLGPEGHRYLRSAAKSSFRKLPEWPRKDTEHTLVCAGLGLYFSKALGLEVVSERELASRARLSLGEGKPPGTVQIPDLEVSDGERRYRVELELSEKPSARYAAAWGRIAPGGRGGDPEVLYVAADDRLARRILRLAGERHLAGIYAVTLAGLKRRWTKVQWQNFRSREFGFERGLAAGPAGKP